jgi:hypothetical protein
MRKLISRVLGGAALLGLLLVGPATQVAADNGDSLAAVRAATAQYHDLDRAVAAGYAKFLPCFDAPGIGGMGQHYVKGSLIDGTVTPTKPQALVYEVDGDELELVAVEYIIPYTPGSTAPQLFGKPFLHNPALGIWALHAWIWKSNPLGMFAPYNPKVELCPGTPSQD